MTGHMDGKEDNHHRNWTKPRILYTKTSCYPWPLDTMKSLDFFKPYLFRETHTQRHKATNLFLFFVAKICRKVPHENIHGETSVLENFPKKKLNRHISKRDKKKEFWNRHILKRKQKGFEITEICGKFGQIPSFLLLKRVYERRAK